jgi:hypothetical protein
LSDLIHKSLAPFARGASIPIGAIAIVALLPWINDVPVAVRILPTDRWRTRIDRGITIVAISKGRCSERRFRCTQAPEDQSGPKAIVVPIYVICLAAHRVLWVCDAVAVVVFTVADLQSPRKHIRISVVAIPSPACPIRTARQTKALPVARAEGISVNIVIVIDTTLSPFFVNRSIAIVVSAVTHLDSLWMDARVAVITVPRNRRCKKTIGSAKTSWCPSAKVVPICIHVILPAPLRAFWVNHTIAVIVHTVTRFDCARIDVWIGIIAVCKSCSTVWRLWRTKASSISSNSKSVIIAITKVYRAPTCIVFVNRTVTVVIDPVANLRSRRIYLTITIVTINPVWRTKWRHRGAKALARRWGTKTISIRIHIIELAPSASLLICLSVAVIVNKVAGFGCARIDILVSWGTIKVICDTVSVYVVVAVVPNPVPIHVVLGRIEDMRTVVRTIWHTVIIPIRVARVALRTAVIPLTTSIFVRLSVAVIVFTVPAIAILRRIARDACKVAFPLASNALYRHARSTNTRCRTECARLVIDNILVR